MFNFLILCPNPGKEAAWKTLPCYWAFYTHPTPKGTRIILTWIIKIWVSQFCACSFQGSWNTFSCPFRPLADTLVSLSVRFCSGLPGSFLAAHKMAQQTFSAPKLPTGCALGRRISSLLLTPWLTGGVRIRSRSQRLFPVRACFLRSSLLNYQPFSDRSGWVFCAAPLWGDSSCSSQCLGISPSQAWDGTATLPFGCSHLSFLFSPRTTVSSYPFDSRPGEKWNQVQLGPVCVWERAPSAVPEYQWHSVQEQARLR